MERSEFEYAQLMELAKSGNAAQIEQIVRGTLREIQPHYKNARARLRHIAGITLFRQGKYHDACADHAVAHDNWTMSVPPELRAENLLAWFYAARMAGRYMGITQRLKTVLQCPSLSTGQKLTALAAYCGGKEICKKLWPFHPAGR